MSLREINEQIALELTEPVPAPETILRIWMDEDGKLQSERMPRQCEAIRAGVESSIGRRAA